MYVPLALHLKVMCIFVHEEYLRVLFLVLSSWYISE